MSSPLRKLLLAAVALGGCFAAHALFSGDPQAAATPAQLDALTAKLATCPELRPRAARQLEDGGGMLSTEDWEALMAETGRCQRQRQSLSEAAHYRLAYAALKAQLSGVGAETVTPFGPSLKLSTALQRP